MKMDPLDNISALLMASAFRAKFDETVVDAARRHHSFFAYDDPQGRMVREYPATSEVFLTSPDRQTLTLLAVHGQLVSATDTVVVPATAVRLPYPSVAAH